MKKEYLAIITVVLIAVLLLSGCTTEQNTNQNQTNNDESDPCGNDVGNGYEIVSGPDVSAHSADRDNPFRTLTVHPTNPDVLLIGTERNGFIKTIDGGETWTRCRKGLRHVDWGYPEIYDIGLAVSNPNVIYAATTDGPGPATGNYLSSHAGVYKSVDGGETWVRKNCGLPSSSIISVYVDPNDENHVFIGVEDGAPSFTGSEISDTYYTGGMYETFNGGDSWQEVELGPLDYKNTYLMIRSTNDSSLFAFGLEDTDDLPDEENIGFIKSTDGGDNWEQFAPDMREIGVYYFDVSSDGQTIYAVPKTSEIYISNDAGVSWTSKEMSTFALYCIAVSPVDEKRVLYGKNADLYLSTDGLVTEKKAIEMERIEGRHFADIAFVPSDPNIVYAITTGGYPTTSGYNLYKSIDAGENFMKIANLRDDVLNVIT